MSLPIIGSKLQPREPTHQALDFERMIRLAADVEDALDNLGGLAALDPSPNPGDAREPH